MLDGLVALSWVALYRGLQPAGLFLLYIYSRHHVVPCVAIPAPQFSSLIRPFKWLLDRVTRLYNVLVCAPIDKLVAGWAEGKQAGLC